MPNIQPGLYAQEFDCFGPGAIGCQPLVYKVLSLSQISSIEVSLIYRVVLISGLQ